MLDFTDTKLHFETREQLALTETARLAVSVNSKHREVQRLGRTAKEIAAEIGEELIKVKDKLAHGEFGRWCEAHLSFSKHTRARYIKVAEIKSSMRDTFQQADSINDVLDYKSKPTPKHELRAATLGDLRKVERLRALRDDPSASEGEKANAQAKLDEIEKEIGKVEPERRSTKDKAIIQTNAEKATDIILRRDLSSCSTVVRNSLVHALINTYGDHPQRLQNLLKALS